MTNPIQVYTGNTMNLPNPAPGVNVPWTTPPALGNWVIVAVYGWNPYGASSQINVFDSTNNNNRYVPVSAAQNSSTLVQYGQSGGYDILSVWYAQVKNNTAPFSVSVCEAGLYYGFAKPYYAVCCLEVSDIGGPEPIGTPTSMQTTGIGISLQPSSQTPSQNNDFAVALMSTSGYAQWSGPSGWNVGISNQLDNSNPTNGEIDFLQLSGEGSIEPVWTDFAAPQLSGQCMLALFRGASPGVTFAPSPTGAEGGVLTPAFSGKLVQTPLAAGAAMAGVLSPRFDNRSYFCLPSGGGGVLPPRFGSSGTITQQARVVGATNGVLPPSFSTSGPSLQIKRGPLSILLDGAIALKEGEFYEAGQVESGTSYTVLFQGGHDGTLKVVGGGVQTVTGPPSWTPPANMVGAIVLWDSSNHCFYVSTGGPWTTIT